MAGYLNKVQLIGNLGCDPEIRSLQSGGKVLNLPIATTESWTDKRSGEHREQTEWHCVVIFSDGLVDFVETYLRKGNKVYVEGSLKTRKWTDQHSEERYSTDVVLQPFNGKLIMLGRANGRDANNALPSNEPTDKDLDDNIPF
jgi:single-strand DNA-binding protein